MKKTRKRPYRAQTAIEYLILLGIVTAIALAGFYRYLPQARDLALNVFNETARGVMGDMPASDGKARTYKTDYP